MPWQGLSDFLDMGGQGLYVWGSLVMSVGVLLWEVLLLRQRRRRAITEVRHWCDLHAHEAATAGAWTP